MDNYLNIDNSNINYIADHIVDYIADSNVFLFSTYTNAYQKRVILTQ